VKHLYTLFLYLFLPVILIRLLVRGFKNPDYWHRWGERFGRISMDAPADVWVHAVSVGEARAAAPLIQSLLSDRALNIIVTTMTPTGMDEVNRLFGDSVAHCYAPYDYPGSVNRFLDAVQPGAVIIMETEIWPNIISACSSRGIPVLFANLRLSEKSFRKYIKVSSVMAPVLKKVSRFAVQSDLDSQHLQELGALPETIRVTGSIKFEVRIPASLNEVALVLRREWGQERPVWIAGSTHEGEDEMVLDVFRKLREDYSDLVLVLVPRHPERFAVVTRLARKTGFQVVCRSESRRNIENADIYIGDTMGDLTLLYAASDIALVGGSMIPHGGHNVLEPCALGVPVIYGPHMFNFRGISRLTLEKGAGVQVENEQELLGTVKSFLSDPNLRFITGEAGRALIKENKGALHKTLSLFSDYLGPAPK
jgi:3-deoxy-D-manno-octulosonic-acid transferase